MPQCDERQPGAGTHHQSETCSSAWLVVPTTLSGSSFECTNVAVLTPPSNHEYLWPRSGKLLEPGTGIPCSAVPPLSPVTDDGAAPSLSEFFGVSSDATKEAKEKSASASSVPAQSGGGASYALLFLVISREVAGTYRLEVVSTDPRTRRFHAQRVAEVRGRRAESREAVLA